jgi:hypothetical protein
MSAYVEQQAHEQGLYRHVRTVVLEVRRKRVRVRQDPRTSGAVY